MKITLRLPCLIFLLSLAAASADAQSANGYLAMPKDLVSFNSIEGRRMFEESRAKEPFWQLVQFYSAQPDLGSCSVASSIMVLNALPIDRPLAAGYGNYKLFTPINFFSPEVEAIKSRGNSFSIWHDS